MTPPFSLSHLGAMVDPVAPDSELTVIDLFAGCGGMTRGFVDAGFEPVLAVEWDEAAAATYAANFDPDVNHTICADIATVASADVPRADVVIGGPPCQGFSGLGLQDVDDPRNKLWTEYVRVVLAAQPEFFVIENVDRFRSSGEYERLVQEVERGDLADYEITTAVLNAADFGVAQRRKRTIVVGRRGGSSQLPEPTHSRLPALGMSEWVTVRDALGGVPVEPHDRDSLHAETVRPFGNDIRGTYGMDEIHIGRHPTPLSLERYALIPPGGGRFDLAEKRPDLLPPCWRNKKTGTGDVMGRLRWDETSVTIRTEFFKPEKGRYLHPQWGEQAADQVNRPITHREAALLQSFPDSYLWCGSKLEIARQIGNAVPPVLANAIARRLASALAEGTEQEMANAR
jgi:DNA (cytosine-5)-methyltransferase 1